MREHTETLEDFVLEERVRQGGYHYLAELFRDPVELSGEPELPKQLAEIVGAVEDRELHRSCDRLVVSLGGEDGSGGEDAAGALRRDYTALFVGPQNLLAPPYGSVYLEPAKRQVMGESTQDVMRLYRQAGLEVSREFKQPPDHIRLELRFMSHVIKGVIDALSESDADWERAGALVNTQLGFLQRHLVAWVKPFTHLITENSSTAFYSALAEFTERFVAYDYQHAAKWMYEDFARLNQSSGSG